ncbi:hypothetical protein C0J52_09089 [Blattella germanica]|nr:hypothetical protein C0J52_09089 [Blattella germanica]
MEDEEREDLLIRASSDNEEFTDNDEAFDVARNNVVQQDTKINTLYEKVQFLCLSALLCLSSTALIVLLPLYLEVVDRPGDAYTALLFTSWTTLTVLLCATCVVGHFWGGIKTSLLPPFSFLTIVRIGLIYGISCFVVIYSLERKKVICHLQDPIKGVVLVFSLVYYFFFCRKMMGLQKIFCSTTIIVGLFISVDYGLCDEFRCRGNERESRREDAGDWSWQSHAAWTFAYVVFTYIGPGNCRLATVSRLVSTQDSHSHSSRHSRPLLQLADESNETSSTAPLEQRRHITFMKQHFCDSSSKPHTLTIALWLHLVTAVLVVCLCWTDMIPVLGKVSTYAWAFVAAYVLFVLSSLKFLIVSESAVFTVAMATTALPLAGIWWSIFRLTWKSSGLVAWGPVVTGELICSILGLPIVLTGVVLLCKAHFKERSYGKVAIACLRQ